MRRSSRREVFRSGPRSQPVQRSSSRRFERAIVGTTPVFRALHGDDGAGEAVGAKDFFAAHNSKLPFGSARVFQQEARRAVSKLPHSSKRHFAHRIAPSSLKPGGFAPPDLPSPSLAGTPQAPLPPPLKRRRTRRRDAPCGRVGARLPVMRPGETRVQSSRAA